MPLKNEKMNKQCGCCATVEKNIEYNIEDEI
jgi:hypothetical protein